MTGGRHLLLIDGLSIARRIWEAIPVDDSPEKAVGATRSCIASFTRALEDLQPTHVLAAFDHGGATWRHEIYPGYHAGRKPMPESMRNALPSLIEKVRAIGIHAVSVPGVEADDVIATAFHRWVQQHTPSSATILSTDKDLTALVAYGAWVRDHFKDEYRDDAWVHKKFGVTAAQLQDLLALWGDQTDGVPGVPGVGVKTAAKWLGAFGNLECVLEEAALDAPSAGSVITGKARESLRSSLADVRLARELVGFKTDLSLGLTWNALRYTIPETQQDWSTEPTI